MIRAEIGLSIDEMLTPHGSFAEYAIAWAYTTFHLPKKITFEEVLCYQQLEMLYSDRGITDSTVRARLYHWLL